MSGKSNSSLADQAICWLRNELTGRRLAFNIIWWGIHWGLFAYGWWSQATNERLAGLNTLKFSVWVSRGAGLVLAFDVGLLLVPMLRNLVTFVRPSLSSFLPADENVWLHRQTAFAMLLFTILHSHVALFLMMLIYTTAAARIRKQCFEAFWYTHNILHPLFFLAIFTHATGCFVRNSVKPDWIPRFPFYSTKHCLGYQAWRFTIWPFLLYFGERMLREIRYRQKTTITAVIMHPGNALEVRFVKPGFRYNAGMWLFLNVSQMRLCDVYPQSTSTGADRLLCCHASSFVQCPEVSYFQAHPFTISSAPDDPYISCHIRLVGDWTQAFATALGVSAETREALSKSAAFDEKALKEDDDPSPIEIDPTALGRAMPKLRVDGPFGAPAEDIFKSDVCLLVASGIGVTPFSSLLKDIWYRQQQGRLERLRRVELVWICRDTSDFEWFADMLSAMEDAQTDPNFLRINIYLTAKLDQGEMHSIALNDMGSDYDPLTTLRSKTFFGRPDWKNIYRRLVAAIESGGFPGIESSLRLSLGTYFCGPNELAKTLRRESNAAQTKKVSTIFKKEHF